VTWLLNPRLLAITAILILLAGSAWHGYSKGKQSGMSQIQTLWDAERAVQLAAQAEAEMKARQTEQALQKAVNRIRQEKQREAIKLANDYAAVVDSLHDRAEARASDGGVPEGATPGAKPAAGCTGAQLSGPDSRFLAGEAQRADQLRIALRACVGAYDAARREVSGE
jgi:hypothetical protein